MRKLIATITLFTITTSSYAANWMCDNKSDQREYDQCYEYAVNGGLTRMKKNYDIIMASSKVPQSEKDYIPKAHKKWWKEVNKRCSDNTCYYGYISTRNNEIEQYMVKRGLNPI
ncbi:Uncharacterised protein [Burkholderia pseudomallei]|uniref:hypothetical protein n=1 Tax=Burkholderia pseudomallei TaxID=28450 RepID=UPI000F1E0BFC|nr:hypothetical protein [Burkholderia pseudomallei]CAJ5232732.1 Uncharacterised protein [Burkholderia pseudomallei]CAJ7565352.1 Uncharacterised protein [Burkholderia pseudomallei]CAK0348239.1 Uncharacterised protein [Burkholderia pseudomallei]VCH22767.1 Uncharacterised protein [Burkholderia pseudomallei]VCH61665.1 Uncharacterised protein [Burkholderia pseudomallei]